MPSDNPILLVRRTAKSLKLSELTLSDQTVIQPFFDCMGCGTEMQPLYHDAQFCCSCRARYVEAVLSSR